MSKKNFYTYSEYIEVCKILGVKSHRDYRKKQKSDPRLPYHPENIYEEWTGWTAITGRFSAHIPEGGHYTWREFLDICKYLNITSKNKYAEKRKEYPRLPRHPELHYKEWTDWSLITGNTSCKLPDEGYYRLDEFIERCKELKIKSQGDYKKKYKIDPRLHSNPYSFYSDWQGWKVITGNNVPKLTPKETHYDWKLFLEVCKPLDIKNRRDYKKKQKDDPRLPHDPKAFYPQFSSYAEIGGRKPRELYSLDQICRILTYYRVTSSDKYQALLVDYLGLPNDPVKLFKEKWPGFEHFDIYPWPHFVRIMKWKKVKSTKQYEALLKQDSRLPEEPASYYQEFTSFKTLPTLPAPYETYEEFRIALRTLKIELKTEYQARYWLDPRLPSAPHIVYRRDWFNWQHACSKPLNSLDTKKFISRHMVKNSLDYKVLAAKDCSLVNDPTTEFMLESFEELLTLEVYNAEKVLAFNTKHDIYTIKEYEKEFADNSKLAHLVRSLRIPENKGKVIVPDKPWYAGIPAEYSEWTKAFDPIVNKGTGIPHKKGEARRFIQQYLVKHNLSRNIADFFSKEPPPVSPLSFISELPKSNKGRSARILYEMLANIYNENCCFVDEDTSETVSMEGYKNHFASYSSMSTSIKDKHSQSVKYALPLYYLRAAQNYLAPPEASSFSELTNAIDMYNSDWFYVDKALINKDDPDCVWREFKGKYQMWSPVRTVATIFLTTTGHRGQQICWLDSGEADEEILENINGKFTWVKNSNHLLQSGFRSKKNVGFLRKIDQSIAHKSDGKSGHEESPQINDGSGSVGSYINTNKTGKSFEVPWVDSNVIKWTIHLRNWQTRYNPLSELTAWTEIKLLAQKDENEMIARGYQAFLFREFYSGLDREIKGQPILPSKLMTALPILLYRIQDKQYPLAWLKKGANPNTKGSYESKFSPHAMRVSIITTLVMDYGLPLHIVAKLVGHAQILMTLYYTKINERDVRHELSAREEQALASAQRRLHDLIEANQYDDAKKLLRDASNGDIIDVVMVDSHPRATLSFKDYGICPYSNSACDSGGSKIVGSNNSYGAVPRGYLGINNCLQCRYFITGVPYIGALSHLANEISLERSDKIKMHEDLNDRIRALEREQLQCQRIGIVFTKYDELLRTNNQSESLNNKIMTLSADMVSAFRFIQQSLALLNTDETSNKTQLILAGEDKIEVKAMIEEVSEFHHISEVCRRSEFYMSAEPDRAIPKLGQALDNMLMKNNIRPMLCTLSPQDQLKIANQMTQMLLSRLNWDWTLIDGLISGEPKLSDFGLKADDFTLEKLASISLKLSEEDNTPLELRND